MSQIKLGDSVFALFFLRDSGDTMDVFFMQMHPFNQPTLQRVLFKTKKRKKKKAKLNYLENLSIQF